MDLEQSAVKFWKCTYIISHKHSVTLGSGVLRTLGWKSFRRIEAIDYLQQIMSKSSPINIIDFSEIDEEAYMYFNEHSLEMYQKEEKDNFETKIISHYHYNTVNFVNN